jgi:hypothetical protein
LALTFLPFIHLQPLKSNMKTYLKNEIFKNWWNNPWTEYIDSFPSKSMFCKLYLKESKSINKLIFFFINDLQSNLIFYMRRLNNKKNKEKSYDHLLLTSFGKHKWGVIIELNVLQYLKLKKGKHLNKLGFLDFLKAISRKNIDFPLSNKMFNLV